MFQNTNFNFTTTNTEIIVFSHDKWRVWRRYMENDTSCRYNLFALFAIIFQLSFYGTGMFHPLEMKILSKVKCCISYFFGYLYTYPNIGGVHSAIKDISVFIPNMEALVCGRHPDIPLLAWLVGRCEAGGYRHSDNTSCLSVIKDISDCGSVMKLALSWSLTLSTS